MDLEAAGYHLTNLQLINVVLGKNGCGKSTMLKAVESQLPRDGATFKYVTPERGGTLVYEAGVEQNVLNDSNWLSATRRVNQFPNFKQQTVAQYRSLETSVLRLMEEAVSQGRANEAEGFQATVDLINTLLDNIQIRRTSGPTFEISRRDDGAVIGANQISSGESELIALAIECVAFSYQIAPGKTNIMFLDEPDVHLHPDLQARLTRFLVELVERRNFTVVMATHSTAMLGELSGYAEAAVAFMRVGQTELAFLQIGDALKEVLPVFGAHPLSSIFNSAPVLIVEGEDDLRIWQQAIRSSKGAVSLYPVDCGGLSFMSQYENIVRDIAEAVYDTPTAFSLRDGDDHPEDMEDLGLLTRLRLHCRAAENLMLSEESLARAGTGWEQVQERLEQWISKSEGHPRHHELQSFRDGGFDRRFADLKEIRMLIAAEGLAISRPWEVHVGQALGMIASGEIEPCGGEASLLHYLGERASTALLSTHHPA